MPDPIRIRSGSAGKHWPEAGRMILVHWFASGPDPFGPNLTQSARTKSDPGWFFPQYYPERLWKNGTESQSGKLVANLDYYWSDGAASLAVKGLTSRQMYREMRRRRRRRSATQRCLLSLISSGGDSVSLSKVFLFSHR